VQDEIAPAEPVYLVWNFHTFAEVEIAANGRRATLTRGGQKIQARILAPANARFSTVSAQIPPPNAPNPGVTNLVIKMPHQLRTETIAVLFTRPGDTARPAVSPLPTWK
jgi:hypothetical protein